MTLEELIKMRMDSPGKRASVVSLGLAVLAAALFLGTVSNALAQEGPSTEEQAQANNPLAGAYALNFQNFYSPSLYGVPDRSANTFWVRTAIPIGRTLTRASVPLATRPASETEAKAGLGDFNIFTAYLFVSDATTSVGFGPLLVAPTATDDALGQGKWQGGAAAVFFKATPIVQVGGLVTWQGSFAGDSDRADTSILAVQPFAVWQLGGGTYLRSTGIWVFDLKTDSYVMPFGLGIGKVLKSGNVVYNMFVEPQFSFLHNGTGQPKLQVFTGLHFQFPRG
jgi:hypothetical protein